MRPTDLHTGLTQERLKALLDYEPATGVFRWRVWRPNGVKPGDEAGTVGKSRGYRNIKVDKRTYLASRLAWLYMTGEWPDARVDHKDLDKINNRWGNLRAATMRQNQHNKTLTKANTTGFKGVTRHRQKWQAHIRVDGCLQYLGTFDNPERAHAAYVAAATRHFGTFARAA